MSQVQDGRKCYKNPPEESSEREGKVIEDGASDGEPGHRCESMHSHCTVHGMAQVNVWEECRLFVLCENRSAQYS
jgi:hypothetical protein